MKVIKVHKNDKHWVNINPMEIKTPTGVQTVSRLHYNGVEETLHLIFSNGNDTFEIDCTFNHSFRMSNGEWIQAEYIEEHHIFDNNYMLVSSLVNKEPIATYDFEVPKEHCYILNSGIISHNTALLMGGVSEGINPDPAMVFTQSTAGGEVDRINPVFLEVMKAKGKFDKKTIKSIVEKNGSVQHLDWLTDEEKLTFRTAFEIDQKAVLRLASARATRIDQGQSLNLFFSADEDEEYISEVHQQAFMDENIKSLYYIYTLAGVQAAKNECLACS